MRSETPHILLVEEDETLADVTSFRLELLGYRVTTAGSGEDALDKVDAQLPDLIILDLVLPGIDGIELINRLKNSPQTNPIPVMVFSIDANLESVQKAFAAGAKEYLVTPYDPAVLEMKLEQLLELAGKA